MTLYNLIVGLALLMLAAWMIFLLIVLPSDAGQFIGVVFLAVGAVEVALHRMSARWTFKQGISMPLVSGFWKRVGPEGVQELYLGIGLVLMAAGSLFLVKYYLYYLRL
jgi:hypothetical protein